MQSFSKSASLSWKISFRENSIFDHACRNDELTSNFRHLFSNQCSIISKLSAYNRKFSLNLSSDHSFLRNFMMSIVRFQFNIFHPFLYKVFEFEKSQSELFGHFNKFPLLRIFFLF